MSMEKDDPLDILLAANAGLIPELALPTDMHRRVLSGIMQRVESRGMQVVRQNEGLWREIFPGVSIKILQEDSSDRSQTSLWRLQPGASVPRHQHFQNEECLVLEGSIIHAETEYLPGDYLLSPAGVPHEHFMAPNGALFLIRGEILDKAMMI